MPSLREAQAGFAAALFSGGAHTDAPGIRAGGISPSVRLTFYRTNVFENYRRALSATYAAVKKLVAEPSSVPPAVPIVVLAPCAKFDTLVATIRRVSGFVVKLKPVSVS